MENAISNLHPIWGVENLGRKMLNLESPIWDGSRKFGAENAISNLEFGGWKIWGGKLSRPPNFEIRTAFGAPNAYLDPSRIWGVESIWGGKFISNLQFLGFENLGWKVLPPNLEIRDSMGGGRVENLGFENAISKFLIWEGGKFGVENVISNLEFGGWKIWGGKCYLESPNFWGEKFGAPKFLSRISNLGGRVENLGWKMLSRISNLGGGKFGAENAISNLEFGG